MINVATTPPPEELIIDDEKFIINTDYRTWIKVSELLKKADTYNSNEIWNEIQYLVFGYEIYCDIEKALNAIIEFLQGYPIEGSGHYEINSSGNELAYSFVHDINLIILAIRNQSGIDIGYNCKHFHWWLFLLEFNSLEERHLISHIIGYRAYDGDDKELLELKRKYALPYEYSEEEKRQGEELNSAFYNC